MKDSGGSSSRERIAVTGLGVLSALGRGVEAFWTGLSTGRCGIGEITAFDCSRQRTNLGAQVLGWQPEDDFSRRERRLLSRCDMLGILAVRECWASSGLTKDFNPERGAVVLGAGAGGSRNGELFYREWKATGGKRTHPAMLISYAPSATTDWVTAEIGATGPRATFDTACSSSNTAIGYAAELIRSGRVDFAVTGGAEGLAELTYTGFNALKAISREPCRPFDRGRDGLSLGETGALLLLENWEHAQRRNARIWAEFLGFGLSADAYHMTAPEPAGRGALTAMKNALVDASLEPNEIDYISAHGTATLHNDLAEARAIAALFGSPGKICGVPVSAPKSMVGHCLGASAAIEAVAAVLTLVHDLLPPTVNHRETDPECPIDCVPNSPRPKKLHRILSNSFAFGGNNTSIVFGKAGSP